jgi:DNA-binding CsgD family transcriptional regulator
VHPAARLAEVRILQGRFDEAEQLLDGFDAEPDAIHASVALRLARGESPAAATLLERRLQETGTASLLAVPFLAQLVQARIATGDLEAARSAADELELIAGRASRDRVDAAAALARARVGAATGDADAAAAFEHAVSLLERSGLLLEAARARLELAKALASSAPDVAIDVARRAYRELASFGADRDADAAAALLRTLGVKNRSGPRDHGVLSKRETEVLRLLGDGLSNAEIAKRLFISAKTAEHHVSRIYAKLELRSRAEAAAYAARTLGA